MDNKDWINILQNWYDKLCVDGGNTKAVVREEIKNTIEHLKKPMLYGILVKENKVIPYEFEHNGVDDLYKALDCRLVGCYSCELAGHQVDIWYDDEFLMKSEKLKPSFLSLDENEKINFMLYGNIFICGCNEEGDCISLNDKVIYKIIDQHSGAVEHQLTKEKCNVLITFEHSIDQI